MKAGVIATMAGMLSLMLPTVATVAVDEPSPTPTARPTREEVRLDKRSVPVRIQVPYAGIDLPVVSSERKVAGNARGVTGYYPLCDVAQYWTKYALPGAPGTTWIYGHAQPGMFLPLFTISEETDGNGLLGKLVLLQLKDGRLLRYRINQVKERAYDRRIAQRGKPSQHRLILQTSTGPPGTVPKLQVAATLIDARMADERAPKAKPRVCWQPKPTPTPKRNKNTSRNRATPEPAVATEVSEPFDAGTLLVGSVAVLLGATLLAVYLVRRGP